MRAIGGLIQQKYGNEKETYSEKLKNIFRRFETQKDSAVESVKDSLKN